MVHPYNMKRYGNKKATQMSRFFILKTEQLII